MIEGNNEKNIAGKCLEQEILEKKIMKKAEKHKQLDYELEEIIKKINLLSNILARANMKLVF